MTRRASVAAPSEPVSITIIVPGCPSRILAPNRRAHGKAKAAATLQHRSDAFYAASAARSEDQFFSGAPVFTGPVAVEACIYWSKNERVKDLDSCAVMVKPMIDGLVDAGIMVNDSQMHRLTVSQEPYRMSKTTGQVILTITAIQEGQEAA